MKKVIAALTSALFAGVVLAQAAAPAAPAKAATPATPAAPAAPATPAAVPAAKADAAKTESKPKTDAAATDKPVK